MRVALVSREARSSLAMAVTRGVSGPGILRRPTPLIWWLQRHPLIKRPRDCPSATNYLIHVYVIDDYVLCLLLTLFMHYSDDFYDDECDFIFAIKLSLISVGLLVEPILGFFINYATQCMHLCDFV
jgi:hypothetical protein